MAASYCGIADDSAVTKMPYIAMDITDEESVQETINGIKPDAIIHCAAWTAVDLAEDEDKIDNFTLYTIKSNDTGFVEYTIEVEGVAEKLKLMQIVTDSTVFEIDAGGGDVPADVAT